MGDKIETIIAMAPATPGWVMKFQHGDQAPWYAPVACWVILDTGKLEDALGGDRCTSVFGVDALGSKEAEEILRRSDFVEYIFCQACFRLGFCNGHRNP